MDFIKDLVSKSGGDEIKAKAHEANYILFDYKPQEVQEKEIVDKARFVLFFENLNSKVHIWSNTRSEVIFFP